MNLFEHYYLTKDRILDILKNDGIIVFDTSALLDLYYYSEDSRNKIFKNVFPYFANRLWLPAQVYLEFLKNKDTVAAKPEKTYMALLDKDNRDMGYVPKLVSTVTKFEKDTKELEGILTTLKEITVREDKHPFLEQEIFEPIDQAVDILKEQMEAFSAKVEDFQIDITQRINDKILDLSSQGDEIQNQIEEKFTIGEELTYEQMTQISVDGRRRYEEKIPPGYMDQEDKTGLQKYGDLFVWMEILNHASECGKDVILITNDVKEDWVDKKFDRKPRFELLKEFRSTTQKNFWMCNMKDFLYLANEVIDEKNRIPEKVMEDVDEVSNQLPEESDDDAVIRGMVSEWMDTEAAVIIDRLLPVDSNWKVFGNNRIYNGIDYRGEEWIVLAHLVEKFDYASILHALTNLREIKRDYDQLGKEYYYSQLIILKDKASADKFMKKVKGNAKLSSMFSNVYVQNTVLYMMRGRLFFVDANHAMG